MEELLGLDIDKNAFEDLKQAKEDRKENKKDAYVELNSLYDYRVNSARKSVYNQVELTNRPP